MLFLKAYPKCSVFWDALSSLYLIKPGEGICQLFSHSVLLQETGSSENWATPSFNLPANRVILLQVGDILSLWRTGLRVILAGWFGWRHKLSNNLGLATPHPCSLPAQVKCLTVSAGKPYSLYCLHLGVFFIIWVFSLFFKSYFILEPNYLSRIAVLFPWCCREI